MTTKEKNQAVDIIKTILVCATKSQSAVNDARNVLINFIENLEDKNFQQGIDFAIEIIADEFRDFDITERDLKNLF